MDWQQGNSKEKLIQFIPAEKGWLALFEETTSEGTQIHADPVIAWCLGAQDLDDGHGAILFLCGSASYLHAESALRGLCRTVAGTSRQ